MLVKGSLISSNCCINEVNCKKNLVSNRLREIYLERECEKSNTFLAMRQYEQLVLEKITTLSFAIASVTNFIAIAVDLCVL